MEVFKFGGASVKDADSIRNMRKIVSNHDGKRLLVVVSAMGKTTNIMQTIANQILAGADVSGLLASMLSFHEDTCRDLLGEIPVHFQEIKEKFISDIHEIEDNELAFSDKVIAYGELFSTSIISTYLGALWLDARDLVKTDSKFSEAEVNWPETAQRIGEIHKGGEKLLITQGFIGSDAHSKTTTLGREGSDFTGAIFAWCLGANGLTVWKDVPGLLTADPKILANATKLDHVSYQEVIEMTYYGAKVIHPKTIYPLAQKGIPLFVKSFIDPAGLGTEISEGKKLASQPCFIFKQNQLLFTVRMKDSSFMNERKMSAILMTLSELNIKANLMQNSALTFTFCMDHNIRKQQMVIEKLEPDFHVLYNENLSLLTVKNYDNQALTIVPEGAERIIEEKTRLNYQVVYRLQESI